MRIETDYKAIAEKAVRNAAWEDRMLKRNQLIQKLRNAKIREFGDTIVLTVKERELLQENCSTGLLTIGAAGLYSISYRVVLDED